MTPLSVVIITFNEEHNIGRCLDSVQAIADDIIVVDSFSTDGTEQICREKGARFIQHAFEGHIEQKNWAITQAKYPHILSLDADEALDDELRSSISVAKENFSFDGYYMNRLNNYCGQWIYHCGWYPDRKLRLWDSRKGRWRGINPHDRFELNEGGRAGYLPGNILHYSYYTVEEHEKQSRYFAGIAARAYFENGRHSSLLKMIINPAARFLKAYLLKRGFQDGYYGWVISLQMAKETYLKYKLLRKLHREALPSSIEEPNRRAQKK